MKTVQFITIFCLCLNFLKAYPQDFDEVIVNITLQALDDLQELLINTQSEIHIEFLNKKTGILITAQERFEKAYQTFSQHLTEIQAFADTANNTDISTCLHEDDIVSPQTFLLDLNTTCDGPASNGAFNFRRLEENKRGHYFFKKHAALVDDLNTCLNVNNPQPVICGPLVASTLQEVERLSPSVRAQPLQFNSELNQQLLEFADCAAGQASSYVKRLNIWHSTFITCAMDLINVNGK